MKIAKNLLNLLNKSNSFNGVTQFDCPKVPNLAPQDLPYCWSLPVVALACIAHALPNIGKKKINNLLTSVNEGLRLVKLVDKTFDAQGGLANIRSAAEEMWVNVELCDRWQDKDLEEVSINGKNSEETLNRLNEVAENTVVMKNPLNWPAKVIGANAMYRVSRTIILMKHEGGDERLFEQIYHDCRHTSCMYIGCLVSISELLSPSWITFMS